MFCFVKSRSMNNLENGRFFLFLLSLSERRRRNVYRDDLLSSQKLTCTLSLSLHISFPLSCSLFWKEKEKTEERMGKKRVCLAEDTMFRGFPRPVT